MTYIDYACYDYSINESEVIEQINTSLKLGVNSISILQYSLSTIKNIPDIKDKKVSLSCPADYPNGLSDSKTRNFLVTQLCKSGVDHIDLMIPTKLITNRKYDKFREDIRTNLEICRENNVELRYILEYRIYNHEVLAKTCQILLDLGIKKIFPSSGAMIDDISDNLIACNFLTTKSKISTICTGNIYNQKQVSTVKNIDNLYGIRFFYLAGLAAFNGQIYFSK
jgi:deoxyribose-phosphate aldolase